MDTNKTSEKNLTPDQINEKASRQFENGEKVSSERESPGQPPRQTSG